MPRPETEELVQAAVAVSEVPGLALAVVEGGAVTWAGGFGVREAGGGEAVDADTIFAVASLSKPPFAYLALQLAARGALELDADARALLSHTSGRGNWDGEPSEPGTWRYSGEGYVALQETIEERTGVALEVLAERELFRPLGLDRTAYVWHDDWSNVADGHGESSTGGHRFPKSFSAFSMHTTATDYAQLVAAMLRDPVAAPMFEPAAHIDAELAWGLGLGLCGEVFWHWGDCGDFQSTVVGSRAERRALVCLTNSEHGLPLCAELTARL
ncbi:MAG TPA: serine hydrolase domain-containing protein, partial [Thermoleophilaceae bacterium]